MLRGVARHASEKLLLLSRTAATETEYYIRLEPYGPPLSRFDLAHLQSLIIVVLPCSVLLLRCILALIRNPFRPELGHR